jgi:CRP/FNR family transcriptional regulator, anaerobic regulatory protein
MTTVASPTQIHASSPHVGHPIAAGTGNPSTDLLNQIAHALPRARNETHRRLERTARKRTLNPGEVAFRQGDPIPLTLMLHGHAALRRTTADGRELVLGIASRGWLFGFSSIAGSLAGVDLVAATPAEVAVWPGDEVRSLVVDDPGLALDVIDGMANYLVHLSDRMDGFIHQDARRRVLRVLVEHEHLFFGDRQVLSRGQLPGLVGTSREMTRRVVRELEREGVIARVGRRGLRLVSPARLHQAVGLPSSEAS